MTSPCQIDSNDTNESSKLQKTIQYMPRMHKNRTIAKSCSIKATIQTQATNQHAKTYPPITT
jgi:hypothetical protein